MTPACWKTQGTASTVFQETPTTVSSPPQRIWSGQGESSPKSFQQRFPPVLRSPCRFMPDRVLIQYRVRTGLRAWLLCCCFVLACGFFLPVESWAAKKKKVTIMDGMIYLFFVSQYTLLLVIDKFVLPPGL